MDRVARILIGIVALLHGGFFVAEFFLWETLTPVAGLYDPRSAAQAAPALATLTVTLGRNLGLCNAIIAGTLGWLLLARDLSPRSARSLATYLLVCIILVGVYGGIMLLGSIPLFQTLPALVALGWIWRKPAR